MPLDPETLARLLREDITDVSVTMPWASREERERYLNATSNFHKRLVDEASSDHLGKWNASRVSDENGGVKRMTKEKLKSLFDFYFTYLDLRCPSLIAKQLGEVECGLNPTLIPFATLVSHCKFMCLEAPKFADDNQVEKSMRWLGFLQGYLFSVGFFNLNDLKEHAALDWKI